VDRNYTFNFDTDAALTSLQTTQLETFDYYQARLDLFNLSLMADYDQLTCLGCKLKKLVTSKLVD
jgi:hypothetical protein